MSRKSCNYESLKSFSNRQTKCGEGCNNNLTVRDDPLFACLSSGGVSKMFDLAPMGYSTSPTCRSCELYLTQYCAASWDKNCDHYETLNPRIRYLVEERKRAYASGQGFSTQPFNPLNPCSVNLLVPQGGLGRQFTINQSNRKSCSNSSCNC